VEAAGVELSSVLRTRNLLIPGTATRAKKAPLPDPLYVYVRKYSRSESANPTQFPQDPIDSPGQEKKSWEQHRRRPAPPFPSFTHDTAIQKVRLAEDAWNTRDPARVALAYTIDSRWRNRSEFINGRSEIIAFLSRKWAKEIDYRLIKEMWAFTGSRIAVRFAYEWHDDSGHWYRSYGNENWEFNDDGLMVSRYAFNQRPPHIGSRSQIQLATRASPR
jgi:nuclear transport factor 2 (NTF2) superfamily protein